MRLTDFEWLSKSLIESPSRTDNITDYFGHYKQPTMITILTHYVKYDAAGGH